MKTANNLKRFTLTAISALSACWMAIWACTSMLVGPSLTPSGRYMLWKHRDTGTEHNFVQRVVPDDGSYRYVGLFNGGDSLLAEAWAGFNETGFGVINTASYNLAPDTAELKDREAIVMTLALKKCRTVDDFATLLDTLPKPMGVQANFGVMDASGHGAYFETDDYHYTRYNLDNYGDGYLIRTNYSFSGNDTDGFGYIRFQNASHLLADDIVNKSLTPASFTEKASRSFWHSLLNTDFAAPGHTRYVIDQDFIPRRITSASVVIEGAKPGDDPTKTVMWVMIGYTPCSYVLPVTIDSVPECLQPVAPGYRSPLCNEVLERKHRAFNINRGNGQHYVDMDYLDSIAPEMRRISNENYNNYKY